MAAMGHEDRFPPPELSACYGFSKQTIAGTHGNERDAPTPAVRRIRPGLGLGRRRPGIVDVERFPEVRSLDAG
jgi:hypothetical protein